MSSSSAPDHVEENRCLFLCMLPFTATAAALSLAVRALYARIGYCVKCILAMALHAMEAGYFEVQRVIAYCPLSFQEMGEFVRRSLLRLHHCLDTAKSAAVEGIKVDVGLVEATVNGCEVGLTAGLGIGSEAARTVKSGAYEVGKTNPCILHTLEVVTEYPRQLALQLLAEVARTLYSGGSEAVKALWHIPQALYQGVEPIMKNIVYKLTQYILRLESGLYEGAKVLLQMGSSAYQGLSVFSDCVLALLAQLMTLFASGVHEGEKLFYKLPDSVQRVLKLPKDCFVEFLAEVYGLIFSCGSEIYKATTSLFMDTIPRTFRPLQDALCHVFSQLCSSAEVMASQCRQTRRQCMESLDKGTVALRVLAQKTLAELLDRSQGAGLEAAHILIGTASACANGLEILKTIGKEALCNIFGLFASGGREVIKIMNSLAHALHMGAEPFCHILKQFVKSLYSLIKATLIETGKALLYGVDCLISLGKLGKQFLFCLLWQLGRLFLSGLAEVVKLDHQIRHGAWSAFKVNVLFPLERILLGVRASMMSAFFAVQRAFAAAKAAIFSAFQA